MNPVALIDKRLLWGHTACAVYAIETAKAGVAYMRIDRSGYAREERIVVIVDAAKFLALVRANERQEPVFYGDEHAWRKDYKFHRAEDGFAHGIANPVPLARPDVISSRYGPCIAFTNGMTRTLWLLANGAAAFPVECRASSAFALHDLAGRKEFAPCTVERLLGFMDWDYFLTHQLIFC